LLIRNEENGWNNVAAENFSYRVKKNLILHNGNSGLIVEQSSEPRLVGITPGNL